jgi:hypothetical protein
MRFFCALFKQQVARAELVALPEVPPFLAAALSGSDREAFLAACWSIRIADGCREFIQRLAQSAVPAALVEWIVATSDDGSAGRDFEDWVSTAQNLRPLQAATAALITIADSGYSPAYLRVVGLLLGLVAKNHAAIHHCLNLLERISQYREMLDAFVQANVVTVLRAVTASDLRAYVVQIYRNLRAAGLVMPA